MPGACRCTTAARERYGSRLSAPLLDRFDIAVRIERPVEVGDCAGDVLDLALIIDFYNQEIFAISDGIGHFKVERRESAFVFP